MAKKKAHLSVMRDRASFENPSTLKNFLAEQLLRGRLSLCLGAGASSAFGLPMWSDLIDRCFSIVGGHRNRAHSCEDAGEALLNTELLGNEIKFAEVVREALYATADLSLAALRRSDLLAAVGALTMASSRGHVGRIISFNFDDILEVFLRYFGFSVQSVGHLPHWQEQRDVVVFHPHGLLPSDRSLHVENPIVFAQIHYDKIVGKSGVLWRNLMLDTLRSTTCLFIGLSGNDLNLRSVLTDTCSSHASTEQGDAFWGIRFSADSTDPMRSMWETRGVYQYTVAGYDEVPAFLFELCQLAASKRP